MHDLFQWVGGVDSLKSICLPLVRVGGRTNRSKSLSSPNCPIYQPACIRIALCERSHVAAHICTHEYITRGTHYARLRTRATIVDVNRTRSGPQSVSPTQSRAHATVCDAAMLSRHRGLFGHARCCSVLVCVINQTLITHHCFAADSGETKILPPSLW